MANQLICLPVMSFYNITRQQCGLRSRRHFFYSLTYCCDFLLLGFGEHPAGSTLTCYWFINNFMMDVYENFQLEFLSKATLWLCTTASTPLIHWKIRGATECYHNPVTISSMKLLVEATDLFSIYLGDGVDFS